MRTYFTLVMFIIAYQFTYAQTWQDVGGGTNNSSHGMLVWNGQLINLGSYNNPCNRVSAWDGTNWTCLGGGVGIVARAGCVWDGKLVVVGDFWNNFQPCVGCNGVAVWDGTSWSALDQGFNNDVLTCAVYDGDLIIGGDFTQANGVPINRVARWNTTTNTFESMGAVTDMDNDVRCMTEFDGELWVGGDFNNVGGNSPNDGLVKWDDANNAWIGGNFGVDLVGGVNETVRVLYVNPNDGNLYMGGEFPELIDGNAGVVDYDMSGIAMYDGSSWYPLGTGLNEYCRAIHEYNGNLIAGGYFTDAGGVACNKIAKWNGSTWNAMGLGFDAGGIDEYVKSAAVWNGIFFAGGAYTQAEGGPMNYIAQWYEANSNPPTAAISSSDTDICPGECIFFSDLSTNAPTSWTWNFPGASTTSSNAQNPGSICYPSGGTYTVELTACNTNGCDMTTQDITVFMPSASNENATVCEGNDFTYPDGTTSTNVIADEMHVSTMTSSNGCDSLVTTNLTVITPVTTLENVDICEGGNHTYPDGTTATNILINESHDSYLTAASGCDSIVTTNITVIFPVTIVESANVCSGGDFTYPDGTVSTDVTLNESHDSYFTGSNGCDSIVMTNLAVNAPITSNENYNVCVGSNFTYPDGTMVSNVTTNESHDSYLSDVNGCDSIVTTSLTIVNSVSSSENAAVCSGENYTYPDGTVSTNITVDESHVSTLMASAGCDSLVTTNLTVLPVSSISETVEVCYGSSYTYPDGITVTNIVLDQTHDSYLTAANGCDSIVSTNVVVNANPTLSLTPSQTICQGEIITLTATPSITGGIFDWSPGAEITPSIIVAPPNGVTTYSVYYEVNGCGVSESTTVTTTPPPLTAVTVTNNVISAIEVANSYQWIDCSTDQPINGETGQSYAPTDNGSYAVEINLNGCVDTSACETISTIGLNEEFLSKFSIEPNPVEKVLVIKSELNLSGNTYVIYATDGKRISFGTLDESNVVGVENIPPGTYFMHVDNSPPLRFIKL